ncbi:MAG: N-acetylmuramoyl-L-alanine amidase-like domain-containing protein [Gammaproteobacteria bacterium]
MRFIPLLLAALLAAPALARAAVPALPAALQDKPLYRMRPIEADQYIAWVHAAEPDLRKRVAAIARKNIGQPYRLNLLGEYPFQLHDELPMFSLDHSDCVVFVEHTYAMALSRSWEEFFWMLQRIRYRDGIIGVATRNHYTEVDWNVANRWLVTDISATLAGPDVPTYAMTVDRASFLKSVHRTEASIPVETTRQPYVPKERAAAAIKALREGDYFNVVSARGGQTLVTHVGLIVLGPDGERHLLHSSDPEVREETIDAFMARASAREQRNAQAGKAGTTLVGFKFLRLNDDIVVPPMAPQPRPGR